MATRYTFTDDSGDVRISGFLSPEPAGTFNGGTITTPLTVALTAPATGPPITASIDAADAGELDGVFVAISPSNFGSGVGDYLFAGRGLAGTDMFTVQDNGTLFFRSGSGNAAVQFMGEDSTNTWNFGTGNGCTFKVANVTKFAVSSTGGVTCGALTATGNVALGDNAADTVAFYGHAGATQQTVTGAKLPSDVVLANLLTALAAMGLIVDSST